MRSYVIVDDNRALAENLAEIIRDVGDQAVVAGSGHEALALVERARYDAVLTDMRMPAMTGAELVRELRRTDPGVPTIVITAFFKEAGVKAAQSEGPLAILPKPVPVPELLHLLRVAKRNGRVLLVDDDAACSDMLTGALQGRGFSVIRLRDAAAIDGLGERPFGAVVELRLRGAPDGAAARRLAERFPGLPLLAVTSDRSIPVPAEASGSFLKPLDTGTLLDAIEHVYRVAFGS